jgi:hypothetical protein
MTEIEAMQLLVKCRELGITNLEVHALVEKSKLVKDHVNPTEIEIQEAFAEDYTDEEMMYWHSPYFDQLQAEKKAKQEKLDGKE